MHLFNLIDIIVDYNESARSCWENAADLSGIELNPSPSVRQLIVFDWLLHSCALFYSQYTNTNESLKRASSKESFVWEQDWWKKKKKDTEYFYKFKPFLRSDHPAVYHWTLPIRESRNYFCGSNVLNWRFLQMDTTRADFTAPRCKFKSNYNKTSCSAYHCPAHLEICI